jgi:hypothetical protein
MSLKPLLPHRTLATLAILLGVLCENMRVQAQSYAPTGAANILSPPDCREEAFMQNVIGHLARTGNGDKWNGRNWSDVERIVQRFMDRCSDHLYQGSFSSVIDYLQIRLARYKLREHGDIRLTTFDLKEEGFVVRGILALKPDRKPRPLVIYKCGLGCDLNSTSMLYTLMVFFDMGPFNVLLLPSNLSETYLSENRSFAVGGLAEGLQLTKIAKYIHSGDWQYSHLVSRLHLYGKSLGGHAALYASLYADYVERDKNLFSSVLVGCPVVDFKASLDHITSDSLIAKLLRRFVFKNLREIISLVPWFDQFFFQNPTYKPDANTFKSIVLAGSYEYYRNKTVLTTWANAPLENITFNREENFWKWMDYSQLPIPKMKTPVYLWAPTNDNVVPFRTNSQKLFRSDQSLQERRIYRLHTRAGGHCMFPSVFGWSTTAAILNSFFVAQSPELLHQMKFIPLRLAANKLDRSFTASSRRWRTGLTWEAHPKKLYVTLRGSYRKVPCHSSSRRISHCRSSSQHRFSFQELGLNPMLAPNTRTEAEALSRTLNSRLRFVDPNGHPLSKTGNPAGLRMLHYGKLNHLD